MVYAQHTGSSTRGCPKLVGCKTYHNLELELKVSLALEASSSFGNVHVWLEWGFSLFRITYGI